MESSCCPPPFSGRHAAILIPSLEAGVSVTPFVDREGQRRIVAGRLSETGIGVKTIGAFVHVPTVIFAAAGGGGLDIDFF